MSHIKSCEKKGKNISLYQSGYAFLNDDEGNILYHPHIDAALLTEETKPRVPDGLLGDETFVRYSYEGVEKQAVWLPLSNGMRLNVTVPVLELNGHWIRLIQMIVVVTAILLALFILIAFRYAGRITKPLRELTKLAEQVNEGNYDFDMEHHGNDEVGALTRTMGHLMGHMKRHVSELNTLAYKDKLTSVRNKAAYDIFVQEMETMLKDSETPSEFAVVVFDCDNLKAINDQYGHDNPSEMAALLNKAADAGNPTMARLIGRYAENAATAATEAAGGYMNDPEAQAYRAVANQAKKYNGGEWIGAFDCMLTIYDRACHEPLLATIERWDNLTAQTVESF